MAPPTVRGETSLLVDGKTYRVKFTWRSLEQVEEELGRPIGQLARELAGSFLDVRACLSFARAGLADCHHDLDAAAVAGLFDALGERARDELQRIAQVGMVYAFPEAEDAPADPPNPARN